VENQRSPEQKCHRIAVILQHQATIMTLIKSISGIRGTIGGEPGRNLTPPDIVKFSAAYGQWIRERNRGGSVVVGRDARISGPMVTALVTATLQALGLDVIDLGLSTTPTVEVMVTKHAAAGGIVITASHNPAQWNALKLLNERGEFISAADGAAILEMAGHPHFHFAGYQKIGKRNILDDAVAQHIEEILRLPLVRPEAIAAAHFKIAVDGVNSAGGIAVPQLLRALGVEEIVEIHCEPNGKFAHNPEPLPENLSELAQTVLKSEADLGIAVDPDVDRLAFVSEDGSMFGEEYTLVAVADYVLSREKGHTVSNLSSSKALKDITEKHGGQYFASAVGEVNVVAKMKEMNAVIGGEGNGGVIYPALHYGRDALVGIALFLSSLAESGKSASMLRAQYPDYHISKNKIQLDEDVNLERVFLALREKYRRMPLNETDGLKIHFDNDWVHLRRSNTEPIIRIYAESDSESTAENLSSKIIDDIRELMKSL